MNVIFNEGQMTTVVHICKCLPTVSISSNIFLLLSISANIYQQMSISVNVNLRVHGAPWRAANRLHGQRTWAFSWRPVLGISGRPTNSGSTLPRTAQLDGGAIGCNQCIPHTLWKCSGNSRHTTNHLALSRMLIKHQLHPFPHLTHHCHDYHTHTPTVTNPTAFHAQL